MDIWQILSLGLQVLSKVRLPSGEPPPEPNIFKLYNQCLDQVKADDVAASADVLTVHDNQNADHRASYLPLSPGTMPLSLPSPESQVISDNVSTACVPCVRAHISAASGALTEALRMARGDGMANAEVADRIRLAQDEIVIAERKDLTPEAVLSAPPSEKVIIDELLPRIRTLRQHIVQIGSIDDLLNVSAEANILGRDLTLMHFKSKGVDVDGVQNLADQVSAGEITMEEAREKVKEFVPG